MSDRDVCNESDECQGYDLAILSALDGLEIDLAVLEGGSVPGELDHEPYEDLRAAVLRGCPALAGGFRRVR